MLTVLVFKYFPSDNADNYEKFSYLFTGIVHVGQV